MKICMIMSNNFPPEEGIGFYVYNLSKKMLKYGHEVTVITRGSVRTKYFTLDGIKVINAPFIPIYPFHVSFHGLFVNKLFKSIEDDFDLLHIHFPLTPFINTSLPVVITLHGSMIENYENLEIFDTKSLLNKLVARLISYPLASKVVNQSDVVTTVSYPLAEEFKKHYNIDDVQFVGNGVNTDRFLPKKNDTEKFINVLYVGRISYGKGLFDLLKAIKNLKTNPQLRFYLAGKGDVENKINKFIRKENLNSVTLLGNLNQDELINLYQNASIFVFPSHYEGFPTVVLEAMSSGLPIVLSDIPAHKSFISDYENGLFFKKGSYLDLAKKIDEVANNKKLMEKLGLNARKTVEKEYKWDEIALKYDKIYRNLINTKGKNL